MTTHELKATPEEIVRGMNLDIDAEARAIAAAAADDIADKLNEACAQKQCGYERRYVRTELAGDLEPLVKQYLTECLSDSSLWNDWEWSFMRDVITPVLGDKVFGETRYAGFGPKSVTMRFKNSPHTPEFGKLMHQLNRRHSDWRSQQ